MRVAYVFPLFPNNCQLNHKALPHIRLTPTLIGYPVVPHSITSTSTIRPTRLSLRVFVGGRQNPHIHLWHRAAHGWCSHGKCPVCCCNMKYVGRIFYKTAYQTSESHSKTSETIRFFSPIRTTLLFWEPSSMSNNQPLTVTCWYDILYFWS